MLLNVRNPEYFILLVNGRDVGELEFIAIAQLKYKSMSIRSESFMLAKS